MTRLPKPELWVFTRDTRLENGKHRIDGCDIAGFPIRLCTEDDPRYACLYQRQPGRRQAMTRLPPPEQWVLSKMNEMEVAEMIEQHIDYYVVDKDGDERSVHLPMPFVRHFMNRSDGVLPTIVALRTVAARAGGRKFAGAVGPRSPARHPVHHSGRIAKDHPEARGLHEGGGQGGDEVSHRSMAGRRRHRLYRQGNDHRRRAHPDRAFVADRPSVVHRHRRTARRRQDHDAHHADHGRHRTMASGVGVVDQRGGAAQGADELLSLRRCLHPVGQYHVAASQISCPHIEKSLHRGLLCRPQASIGWRCKTANRFVLPVSRVSRVRYIHTRFRK